MSVSARCFTLIACAALLAGSAAARASAPDFGTEVKPLLETYCFKCHGNGKKKGGLALDGFMSPADAVKNEKIWGTVLENLRTGDMPPDDEKQPSLDQRERMMKWIDLVVFAVDPDRPDPGRVTIRRLNRVEYNNTVRDLVGVDFQPADDFPADDSGYGFDNIGDVLSLPPVLFDRYLTAAEKIMSAAILNDHKPRPQTIGVDLLKIEGGPQNGSTAGARRIDERESTAKLDLPVAGEYLVRMEITSRKLGDAPTQFELKLDGQPIMTPPPINGASDAPETLKLKVRAAKPGAHTLVLRVTNPLAKPEQRNGKPVNRGFTIRKLELISPPLPVTAPATQIRLLAPGRGQPSLELSARAIIGDFARRAFRRPVVPAEVERFMWIYTQTQKKGGNFEQSVQTALTAVLVSPHFLFRGEAQPDPDNPKSAAPINEWALASRLSYYLWSTMPDDALFAEAQRGTLRKNLDTQVRRMLADPKAGALVENYAGQWLQIRNLAQVQPDAKTYPDWDKPLAVAMERETEVLFDHVMREDRSILDFVAADYTFVNERLARHYGIEGVEGEAFVKVKLPPNRPGGILGHGSFLTLTSNPTRTSPVKRGKYVLENLLGTPPPPPPPDVPDLDDAKRVELKGTLRQKLEQHRKDPMCASCHARMDPIGFGLEIFDGIGAWRERDGQAPIDAAGELVSGETFKGPVELRDILLTKKRADVLRCASEKMLTYALGRGMEYYDRPTIEKMARNLDAKGAKFSALVLEVVKSVPFQMRRGEGDHRKFLGDSKTASATPK
ncbi:MAG: hypothetical protein QOE70_580 [Chthoniobacter sp.]|jgi:hypothetical protein|nr:hypothetical protein [Chthoniobacter sp.]